MQNAYNIITGHYTPTYAPDATVITLSNGTTLVGFVDIGGYQNGTEMKARGQFMFVLNNNAIAFRDEFNITHRKNPDHCILINSDDVVHIKLVDSSGHIKFEHSFNYHIVTYLATINGANSFHGKIGATGRYDPNVTKGTITEQLRKNYPNSTVAVIIQDVQKVDAEQFITATKDFLTITQ